MAQVYGADEIELDFNRSIYNGDNTDDLVYRGMLPVIYCLQDQDSSTRCRFGIEKKKFDPKIVLAQIQYWINYHPIYCLKHT